MPGQKRPMVKFSGRRSLSLAPICAALLAMPLSPMAAQDPIPSRVTSDSGSAVEGRWLARGSLVTFGAVAVGALALAQLDESVAGWARSPSVHGSRPLRDASRGFRMLGDPGAVIFTAGLYGVGRLSGTPSLADAGLHATEAVIVSGAASGLIKLVAGRARPNLLPDGAPVEFPEGTDEFRPLRGIGGYTSFPSGHTTVAFAAASSLASELHRADPSAARVLGPLLYGAAAAVGLSRIRDNQHWASDVVAGAVLGTVVGRKMVAYRHRRPRRGLARWLIPAAIEPTGREISLRWSPWY